MLSTVGPEFNRCKQGC